MSAPAPSERRATAPAARTDLIGGLVWTALGIAIVVASWTMDRLEQFGATPYTAPGLVPGLIGATIVVLGLALTIRSLRNGAVAGFAAPWAATEEGRAARQRVLVATGLALLYALGLVGRVPFPIATALFVFAFIIVFGSEGAGHSPRRRALAALIAAVITSAVVSLTFERVFLVRLP